MAETEKKPTLARKIYVTTALTVVLVVLPLGAWLYLRSGLNQRIAAAHGLSAYGQIRAAPFMHDNIKEDRLKTKVVVVHSFGDSPDLTETNRKILEMDQKLFDQFGHSEYFRMAMIAEQPTAEFRSYVQKMPSVDYVTWVWIYGIGSWKTILDNGFESYYVKNKLDTYPEYYALSDTSGVIRRFYNALDDREIEDMVKQIAIFLPPNTQNSR